MTYPVINLIATGARLKELRQKSGLTVDEVTEYLGGISSQAVYKWQRGECLPTIDNFFALSKLFDTPIEDIIRE